MDDETRSTPTPSAPGAPELGKGVKPPSAPLVDERQTGPVFRAQPIRPNEQPEPASSGPGLMYDDEESDDPPAQAVDERQARIEYLKSLRNDKSRKGTRKRGKGLLVAAIILVVLGALGGAGYFVYRNAHTIKKTPATKASQTPSKNTAATKSTTVDGDQNKIADAKEFTSSNFNLSLSYPGDWTPEELTDRVTITSPVVNVTDGNGQQTSARIVLRIRPKQSKPAEFATGKVVAVLVSDKFSYTKPSSGQRAATYVSYLQYPATTVKGGLDGIYITGNYGYKYAQVVQLSEIANVDPLIDVSFVKCPDATCAAAGQKQLTISSTAWKSDTTNRPAVEAMLKSLVLN